MSEIGSAGQKLSVSRCSVGLKSEQTHDCPQESTERPVEICLAQELRQELVAGRLQDFVLGVVSFVAEDLCDL